MDNKIDIIAVHIKEDHGIDYSDRYLCPENVYNYIFEHQKQSYVWQSKEPCEHNFIVGRLYHIRALLGCRLLGGRGLSISEVEFVGEMNINNKIIRM
ncbi:hypothetical protein [Paenibacillus odorifer]|uniref:hypothetical protein n=1 Tax=Paenibacillus odorifer TaxID=189426 RepID=UPI00096E610E|nr:hypothetical protein [Paenibacillus odorifer]OMD66774.1 hypothetical protein BSK50_30625 [Paenibacillus odorifer]